MQTIKIAILGLGGVGGYYGGKLAKRFRDTSHVEIYFIARGEHLEAIKEYGIHIINENEDFFAKPKLATSDAAEIGPVDYLIITTKSYDLKSSIDQIRPCIDKNTVILPLLNGGDITERIREILPGNTVWSGCSYIVSRRTEPGVIRTSGPFLRLVFGCDGGEDERLVCTDVEDAWVDYIAQVTDPDMFSPGFVDCLAWRLAAELAVPLARDFNRRDALYKVYAETMDGVRASDMGESHRPLRRGSRYKGAR